MEHMHDTHEMAHRVAQIASKICRYAKLMRYIKYDVSQGLAEILPDRPQVKHRASLTTTREIGLLLQAIDSYTGFTSTKYALKRAQACKMERFRYGKGHVDCPCLYYEDAA